MISDTHQFGDRLRSAVDAANSKLLEQLVIESASYVFRYGHSGHEFPEDAFKTILLTINRPEFLKMEGSHYLLNLIMYDWGNLTDQQRDRLLNPLESSFLKLCDTMSLVIVVELLGEHFDNLKALDCLIRLSKASNAIGRELVVHGLEKAGSRLSEQSAKLSALTALKRLCEDPENSVRTAAKGALDRLMN